MSDFDISPLDNSLTLAGNVSSTNPTDIYHLTLSAPGSASFSLTGLNANADLKL